MKSYVYLTYVLLKLQLMSYSVVRINIISFQDFMQESLIC